MPLLYSFFISLSLWFTPLWNFYTIIITSFFTAMFSRPPTTTTTTAFLLRLFIPRLVLLLLLIVLLLLLHFSCLLRFSHFFLNFRWVFFLPLSCRDFFPFIRIYFLLFFGSFLFFSYQTQQNKNSFSIYLLMGFNHLLHILHTSLRHLFAF